MGLFYPLLPGQDSSPELRALVGNAANRASSGDLGSVWELLAPSTRRRFTASHETLLKFASEYGLKREEDRRANICASALERQYGMPLADLGRTTPADVWVRQTSAALGRGAEAQAFADLRIESIETDGTRAGVRARLPDGRPQGFHLVQEEGSWWFVDFRPGLPLEKAGVPARASASSAPVPGRPEDPALSKGPGAVAPR